MSRFGNISLRMLLGLLIGTMGVLLLIVSLSALVDAVGRNANAHRVEAASVTSKQLFGALIGMRLERGAEISGLVGEAAISSATEGVIARARAMSEGGYENQVSAVVSKLLLRGKVE